jgi:hypothetical protein
MMTVIETAIADARVDIAADLHRVPIEMQNVVLKMSVEIIETVVKVEGVIRPREIVTQTAIRIEM